MTQINETQKIKLVIQKKNPDTSRHVKKTDYMVKITKIKSKIPSIIAQLLMLRYVQLKIKYLMLVIQ